LTFVLLSRNYFDDARHLVRGADAWSFQKPLRRPQARAYKGTENKDHDENIEVEVALRHPVLLIRDRFRTGESG